MASVLLIRGSAVGSVAADLATLGHAVTETTATTSGGLDTAWGAGKDLILVASTESDGPASWIKAKWQAGVPVIFGAYWSASTYGPLYGFATSEVDQNLSSPAVTVSGSHAIISGFSGSVTPATGTFWTVRISAGGKGTALATYSSNTILAAIEVGDSLHTGGAASPGATAPARAVYMGWLARSATLSTDGRTLLGQAITWATSTTPAGRTGTVVATLPALSGLTASIAGTHTPPGVTGTVAAGLLALSSLTASIVGTAVPPPVDGTVTATLAPLSSLTASATGTVTDPGATSGTVGVTLPALSGLTAALAGTVTDPAPGDITGTLAVSLTPLSSLSVHIADGPASGVGSPWDADSSGLAIVGITAPVGIFHVEHPAAALPLAVEDVPLTRVSHQIPAGLITVDANGEPVPVDDADYPIVTEEMGRLHIWAGGQDVTYLHDKTTRITSYSAALPFGERNAQFDLPQLMLLDAPPASLDGDKPVDIALVKDDGSRVNLWSGHIVARAGGVADNATRANRQCEGPIMAADHQMHQVPLLMATSDRGKVVADELNATGSRTFGTIAPATTGKFTQERGSSSDRRLDYAQNQLAQLWTSGGDQWTVARTSTPRAYRMALKSQIGQEWTLTYGAPGVQVDLSRDESQRYNVIWGHGSATDASGFNYAWQNMFFPGLLPYDPPDYPFSDTSVELELGTTDADTDTGNGVTVWQERMVEIGFPVTVDGVIHQADKDAAERLQRLRGILANGEIGPQTWNATWDVGATGASLERVRLPLAYDPRVWPTLHAANGKVIGPNPLFDPTIQRYESGDTEYPPGTTKAAAIRSAQDELARNLDPGLNGTIVLRSCPWEGWRGLVREGDRITLLGYEGEDVVLTVAELDVAPDDDFAVTLRVDTKARDAMTLASVAALDRDSEADLARKPGNTNRISQIDRNQTSPFEGESPAGKLPKLAINGDAGLWTVWPVFVSEVGTMAFVDVRTTGPASEFSFGLFGYPITANQMQQYVGNPLTDDGAWDDNVDLLRSRFCYINSWGNSSAPAGRRDDGVVDGREFDDSPLSFVSQKAGWMWVAIFTAQSCSFTGRIYPGSVQ